MPSECNKPFLVNFEKNTSRAVKQSPVTPVGPFFIFKTGNFNCPKK